MADTPEGRVKSAVKKLLTRYEYVYVDWPVPGGYGKPTLDVVGCANGKYFSIECKAPGKHPTPRQLHTISEMEKAGAKVFVIGVRIVTLEEGEKGLDAYQYSGMAELEAWLLRLLP